MPLSITATQEIVIIIYRDDAPAYMVRKNGSVQYFKLREASYQDHVILHGCEVPKIKP